MRRMLATKFVNWIKSLSTRVHPSGTANVNLTGNLDVKGNITSKQEIFAILTPTDKVSTLNYIFSHSIQNPALIYFHFEFKLKNDMPAGQVVGIANSDKSLAEYSNMGMRVFTQNLQQAMITFVGNIIKVTALTDLSANETIVGTLEFLEK